MAYRNLFLSSDSFLKLRNNQLIVNNGQEFSFPVEDIRSIVVENEKTVLSAQIINTLAQEGVCLIICDRKHLPSAMLLPVEKFCRVKKRITLQISQTQPKLKRLWQVIVVGKIQNQALCLEFCRLEQKKQLKQIAKTVVSGDTTNREAYSAGIYFKALFGKEFTRTTENNLNGALNFGYAIIRSYIAKTLVAYGFEPSLGIHHKNQLNAFNLADDIIEPFRPVVDLFVAQNKEWIEDDFSTFAKAQLQKLLNSVTEVNENRCSVAHAIEMLVQSLVTCFEEKENFSLKLPTLCETDYFDYD